MNTIINPLKTYIKNSVLTSQKENTFNVHYINQPVNAVYASDQYSLDKSYKTHKLRWQNAVRAGGA